MKKTRLLSRALILCAAGPLVACSGNKAVNIGNTSVTGGQLSDYAATWSGYAQAFTFTPGGSDDVHLTIDANGSGKMQVGDPPLAPPIDPTIGYPPGSGAAQNADLGGGLYAGFAYPIHSTQIAASRIQFGMDTSDIFAAWCQLQTPAPEYSGLPDSGIAGYGCTPTGGFLPPGPPDGGADAGTGCSATQPVGPAIPVDCDKGFLCNEEQVCACTATSCSTTPLPSGTPPNKYEAEFDAALDSTGTTLTGTLVEGDQRITVILQRQQ